MEKTSWTSKIWEKLKKKPFENKPVELRELNRLKEQATGSKTLGPPDKRFLYGKIIGAALALLIATGITEKSLTRYNRLMVEKQEKTQTELLTRFASLKKEREETLRKAGVKNVDLWQELMARNQYWAKVLNLPEFSPEDYAILEKWLGDNHHALSTLLPLFKHAKRIPPSEKPGENAKELKLERELFKQKFENLQEDELAAKPFDAMLLTDDFNNAEKPFEFLIENNHKPEIRRLLEKLREYSSFERGPFDPDYEGIDRKVLEKIYLGSGLNLKFKVDQQYIDHLNLELMEKKTEKLKK